MFKNSLHLPVKQTSANLTEAEQKLKEVLEDKETLDQMRTAMLCHCIHFEQTATLYQIGEDVSSHAQNIFV